jgi:hypothetical protein
MLFTQERSNNIVHISDSLKFEIEFGHTVALKNLFRICRPFES